ncbi:MAG: hypothetical protein ACRDA3_13045 [Peptostreptococcaceae bacterium]
MDIRNSYLFGTKINLEKYHLGYLYQPKYRDFLSLEIDYFDFIKVFYLSDIFIYKYKKEIKSMGIIFFLMLMDVEGSSDRLINSLTKSLKILYQTENIKFIDHAATFIIDDKIVVDNNNFEILCNVVIEMTKTTINYDKLEDKKVDDDELINEFERRKKEFEEKHSKSSEEISFLDIVNMIIHFQSNVDYEKILDWTIYQLKNTYEVMLSREANYINIFRQASMRFEIQEIGSWKDGAKLNKTKIIT